MSESSRARVGSADPMVSAKAGTVVVALVAACGGGGAVDADAAPVADRDSAIAAFDATAVYDGAVDRDDAAFGDAEVEATDAAAAFDGATVDVAARVDGGRRGAAAWIRQHLAAARQVTGERTTRGFVETPALVHDATACCAKYAYDAREEEAPVDPQIGFVNVAISDLASSDQYGGGIVTANAPGAVVYVANVTIEPGWPRWMSYATTNYDGLVLDDAAAIYAEDLTVIDWNADGAIDNKATVSQFVRLTIRGHGNRGIRYWTPGPHYLVDSTLENDGSLGEGSVLWFQDCTTVELRVFSTTFNGDDRISPSLVHCNTGSDPRIVYLTVDPRTTGEMHEMFSY